MPRKFVECHFTCKDLPVVEEMKKEHGRLGPTLMRIARASSEWQAAKRRADSKLDLDAVCQLLRDGQKVRVENLDEQWRVIHEMCYRGIWKLELNLVSGPGGYRWHKEGKMDRRIVFSLGPPLA